MPHHKSAAKRLKTNERSRKRNLAVKSVLRKQLKKQRELEGTEASAEVSRTYHHLDLAARKGTIPKKRASRLKSRAARQAGAKASS